MNDKFQLSDTRWGSYIPWFLRHDKVSTKGNFDIFFSRVAQRFGRLIQFNEMGINNQEYFGACLESESLQRFRHAVGTPLNSELVSYFSPEGIRNYAVRMSEKDPEARAAKAAESGQFYSNLRKLTTKQFEESEEDRKTESIKEVARSTYPARFSKHYVNAVRERLGVIEVMLRMLSAHENSLDLIVADLHKYFAEADIPLTIRGNPPLIVPFEEVLLEKEVIGKLLPRLEAQFPERAKELISAYHLLLSNSKSLDSIFSEAFKTLEEIARNVTGYSKFLFDQPNLDKYFTRLHPTTKKSIIYLVAHRGDRAGHARAGPESEEIRYLLFQICNIALLMLDYDQGKAN